MPDFARARAKPLLVVRWNSTTGKVVMVVGLVLLAVSLVLVSVWSTGYFLFGAGAAASLAGWSFALGNPCVRVYPNEVLFTNGIGTRQRRYPIDGLGDLVLSSRKLTRRSDGTVLAKLDRVLVNKQDFTRLEAAIGTTVSD